MKNIKSVFLENTVIPVEKLSECHYCDEDHSVEWYAEDVPRGYVWSTYCHACREDNSGYEF
ncbi:hypothetical protein BFP46_23995 [Bacillus licheniformis]|nr:hypothetical protein BFP47_22850 [Bacillus licheniformis]OJT66591.1 hypothetical protein BFP46_23995 [Bacillus licheniformis]